MFAKCPKAVSIGAKTKLAGALLDKAPRVLYCNALVSDGCIPVNRFRRQGVDMLHRQVGVGSSANASAASNCFAALATE